MVTDSVETDDLFKFKKIKALQIQTSELAL